MEGHNTFSIATLVKKGVRVAVYAAILVFSFFLVSFFSNKQEKSQEYSSIIPILHADVPHACTPAGDDDDDDDDSDDDG